MTFHVQRNQHPVGHGFFHTSKLWTDDGSALRYVYDCGAEGRFGPALSRAVDDYRSSWGASEPLDLLCLSHVHHDHVSSLPALLHERVVDTIVLPMLTSGERMIVLAQTMVDRPTFQRPEFWQQLLIDPVHALSSFKPRQVLFVRGNKRGKRAPDGTEPPLAQVPRRHQKAISGPPVQGLLECELVGSGPSPSMRRTRPLGGLPDRSPEVAVMPDNLALSVKAGSGSTPWLLATYSDPETVSRRKDFLTMLRRRLDFPYSHLPTEALLGYLVYDHPMSRILTDTYRHFGRDLNVTSLCLYSGPARPDPEPPLLPRGGPEAVGAHRRDAGHARIGWLGTGDASLKGLARVESLAHHYAGHLSMVATMTLPHHGSDKDMGQALLDAVRPSRCVVTASGRSVHHPGPETRRLFVEEGPDLSIVTDEPASAVREEFGPPGLGEPARRAA